MLKQPAISSQARGGVPGEKIALVVSSANVLTRTLPHIVQFLKDVQLVQIAALLPVKNITILGCCGGGCGGRCGWVRLWLGRPGTLLEDWGAPRSADALRTDLQIRAIGQLPALVCIAGEPVAVGVHLALALTAGEVLLVVEAEDVGLGEGAGRCSESLAVAPLNLGEEGEEDDGNEKGEHHGNLGQSKESL